MLLHARTSSGYNGNVCMLSHLCLSAGCGFSNHIKCLEYSKKVNHKRFKVDYTRNPSGETKCL
jgi:hypothetical protein